MALDGDIGLVRYDIERMVRDSEFLAERADRGVGAGGLRGHHHPHAIAGRCHRIRVGIRHFDRAVHAAEQIDLVGGLKDVFEQPNGLRGMPGQLEDLIRHGDRARRAPRHMPWSRVALGVHRRQCRASRGEIRIGRGQGAVRLQRLLNQRVEPRVIVEPPPGIRRRRRRLGRRIQGHQRRLGARRQRGCVVVRAHPAGGERGGDEGAHEQHGGAIEHVIAESRSIRERETAAARMPDPRALRFEMTTISSATAVSTPMATKPSMTAWVVAAARTTLPNTSSPRDNGADGIDDSGGRRRHRPSPAG